MKRMTRVLAFAVVFAAVPACAWSYQYTVTPLGGNTWAYGINNSGQIAGTMNSSYGALYGQAFVSNAGAGTPTSLGTLGGLYSSAYHINASGQIAGSSYLSDGITVHPVLYSYSGGNWTPTDLGSGGLTREFSEAWGINNAGTVVGYIGTSDTLGNVTYGYAFQKTGGGALQNLNNLLPGGSGWTLDAALAINNKNQIVGEGTLNGASHAFLLDAGTGVMTDLGSYGGPLWGCVGGTQAGAINDAGSVVGGGYDGGENIHAFLWTSGGLQDLGSMVSGGEAWANDINDSGVIVGFGTDPLNPNGNYHAFVYRDGTMTDLNSLIDPGLGVTLDWASGVNDAGQIIATDYNGQSYLLDQTPEPCTMLLLGTGAVGVFGYIRRQPKK
jgi:probable HAF family extracellular repeat protein